MQKLLLASFSFALVLLATPQKVEAKTCQDPANSNTGMCMFYGSDNSTCDYTLYVSGTNCDPLEFCCISSAAGGYDPSNLGWQRGMDLATMGSGVSTRTADEVVFSVLYWITGILLIISVLAFIVSGVMYITAAGNPEQVKKATDMVKWSIVGIVVAVLGYTIVAQIDSLLKGESWFMNLIDRTLDTIFGA